MRWSRVESGPGSALTHPLVRLAIAGGEDESMELILASGREQEARGSVSTLRILWAARANPTARGGCSGGQRPALFAGRRHARTIEHRSDGNASHVHIHRCRRGAKGGGRSPQLRTEANPMLTPMEERQRALVHRLVFRSDLVNSVWGRRTRTDAGVGAVHFGVASGSCGIRAKNLPAAQPSAAAVACRVETDCCGTADHGRRVGKLDERASGGTVSNGSCAATPSGVKCRTFRVRTVQPWC